MNNFNIILKDDLIIGYKYDIIKYLKNEIERLTNIEGHIEGDELVSMQDMLELITILHNSYYNDELLTVIPCLMGGYNVKEIEF